LKLAGKFFVLVVCLLASSAFGQDAQVLEKPNVYVLGEVSFTLQSDFAKTTSPDIENADAALCATWELEKDSLNSILKGFEESTGEESYALCYYLPCYYNLKILTTEGQEGTLSINAASQITLTIGDTTTFYIQQKPTPYFLMACDCCE
jgi:hypothetical protein